MIKGLGGSFIAEEDVRARTFQPREEKTQVDFISVYKYLTGGNEDEGARPSSVEPSDQTGGYGCKLKHGRVCLNIRRQFS